MSPIDTARIQPIFGARELRVYRFEADQPGEPPEQAVWLNLSAECVSARCRLTPTEAREIAQGLLLAASAADGGAEDPGL